ncbi:hypothetical protein [Phyllobacterium chamaecytisi]|uniref:hypothetical protein n=1 Tax=Phyllobacterium chamaecytisi TaxID=2876082 RepID=UPI001CCEFF8C|nr:hypothetical protein [Phyllobacterium sp. KW56]MBZ9603106.1 hypothetical protein [Phyllobacterium sp. KW56]
MSSLIVPLFALLGVLATGVLTFTSTVFKDNTPPSVGIRVFVGNGVIFSAAGAPNGMNAPPGVTATIPVGEKLVFFADQTFDPDGVSEKLALRWSAVSDAEADPCATGGPTCAGRQWAWKAPTQGFYLIQLAATDDADCPYWRKLVFGEAGCNKTAIASVLLQALAPTAPEIFIQPHPTTLVSGAAIKLDASQSVTFDKQLPNLVWTVDGVRASVDKTLDVTAPLAGLDNQVLNIALTATDKFGHFKQEKIPIRITQPELVTATGSAAPKERTELLSADQICRGGELFKLTAPITVKSGPVSCRLPARIVTNGFGLAIEAAEIESANTHIVSFDEGGGIAPPVANGSNGADGDNGRGEGQSGEGGATGGDGATGMPGRSAGEISLQAKVFRGQMVVDNLGQNGGRGGDGGTGGRGGDGSKGASAVTGIFDCRRGPGRGGDGGSGGKGGNGGNAGSGGMAGTVRLEFDQSDPAATVEVKSLGGSQGAPGLGGSGGNGGRPGAEGNTSGFCGSAGRSGQPGANGSPGSSGGSATAGAAATIRGKFGQSEVDQVGAVSLSAK